MAAPEVLGTLGVFALIMAVPITAILTAHQRKMAAIFHAQRNRGMDSDVAARLSQEMSELKQIVAQQAIMLDDINTLHRRLLERDAGDESMRKRLNG